MSCREEIAEIVECARRGKAPGADLRTHLARCGACEERWRAESELSGHFRALRLHAFSPRPGAADRKQALMAQFAMAELARRSEKAGRPSWAWGVAAAAALFLAIGIGSAVGVRSRHNSPQTSAPAHEKTSRGILYEASADAGFLSNDEFIAVPFTPPLATGELVRVIHADLYPEALTSMGIPVNPAWSGNMSADVVVGEDGFPRAVRLDESSQD